jgi:hypothetical protein
MPDVGAPLSSNPGPWNGTSAAAPAQNVARANDAEIFDGLLGALDFAFGWLIGGCPWLRGVSEP